MTLRENIAKLLMQSRTGMTRKDLITTLDVSLYENSVDRISDQLYRLKKAGHAIQSAGAVHYARWEITPQGRAYYSILNDDDETEAQTLPAASIPVDHRQSAQPTPAQDIPQKMAGHLDADTVEIQKDAAESMEWQKNAAAIEIQMQEMAHAAINNTDAVLKFNTSETLDRALYGLVKLIRDVATQQPEVIAIEDKQEAIDLMESLEHNTLFSIKHRETFAKIRAAVALMEDAE